ncbi:MAG: efflux RND transporter permease subunit [Halioglobus sp.]|nr:efflux RND transporter permease subunit [Halioglobus sp.]
MAGPIRWFVYNPIAANLLMVFLLVGGALAIPSLDKEFFPDFELNAVSVSMSYRGAGPSEVEQQICKRIEEAVHDLNGVKEIRSSARQGLGTVFIEAEVGYDTQRLSAEVRSRVDAITTFPVDAERPLVAELAHRHFMAVVTLSGDIGERQLKELGEELRDDLATQPHVSVVELASPRPYEVSVEVSEYTLRRYGLTFADVVSAIRDSSLNLPAGAIKTSAGDIQLQTRGQAYNRQDFEKIPLLSTRDGTQLVVGDVATVLDGFEDIDVRKRFNDRPSHDLRVFVTSNPNTLSTSEVLHDWVEEVRPRLPPGVELALWRDSAELFKGRANTLVKNGIGGLILVFLLLMLFLRPLLAMWVCIGIAVAFMGTFLLLPYTGVSLNMISLLAFLLILGIVVDDAIIVGEAVYSHQNSGEVAHEGAVNGTRAVLKPVMYAVISTMIFVAPMLILPGDMASAGVPIPVVIILALTFSLIECMLILPSHLAHMKPLQPSKIALFRRFEKVRLKFADGMINLARDVYRPFLQRCLNANLLVAAIFIVGLLFSLALYSGGWLRSAFFPAITADFTFAEISLQEGGAYRDTLRVLNKVESAALQVKSEYNSDPRFIGMGPVIGHIDSRGKLNEVEVYINVPSSVVDIKEVTERWRELVGDLGPVESLHMDYTFNDRGKPITMVIASSSLEDLAGVAARLREVLESYPGVYNINDTLQSPREEIELQLKPAAENLSVSLANLARQVREAFYGAEAQRIPRPREDVRVMVRYPERERLSVENLNDMRVRTPAGDEVPFATVAEVSYRPGYLTIDRLDRKRTLKVTADVVMGLADPRAVVDEIVTVEMPLLAAKYSGLTMNLDGELQEEADFLSSMAKYMGLAMLIVYALMAIPFRSYFQPLLVLTAVPFGVMGAIFGHAIFDWQISMFSLLGVIAAAGVVVNDNLVLIDRINRLRDKGHNLMEALLQGGQDRFRPIILTSLTTFVGLMPIMSETSVQAQFLIPMVISLAFGVLFATGVTLLLVPCLYLFGGQVSAYVAHRRQSLAQKIDKV